MKIEFPLCDCLIGWPGHPCEKEFDECILKSCVHDICVEYEPGFNSTCFYIPGFVVKIIIVCFFYCETFTLPLKYCK